MVPRGVQGTCATCQEKAPISLEGCQGGRKLTGCILDPVTLVHYQIDPPVRSRHIFYLKLKSIAWTVLGGEHACILAHTAILKTVTKSIRESEWTPG